MTTHELAKKLLEGPDIPVMVDDYTNGRVVVETIQEIPNDGKNVSSGTFILLYD